MEQSLEFTNWRIHVELSGYQGAKCAGDRLVNTQILTRYFFSLLLYDINSVDKIAAAVEEEYQYKNCCSDGAGFLQYFYCLWYFLYFKGFTVLVHLFQSPTPARFELAPNTRAGHTPIGSKPKGFQVVNVVCLMESWYQMVLHGQSDAILWRTGSVVRENWLG